MSEPALDALPLGQVRIMHCFPDRHNDYFLVSVDGEPVARLPVTGFALDRNYNEGIGHITLRMIAGDCEIASREPHFQGHEHTDD